MLLIVNVTSWPQTGKSFSILNPRGGTKYPGGKLPPFTPSLNETLLLFEAFNSVPPLFTHVWDTSRTSWGNSPRGKSLLGLPGHQRQPLAVYQCRPPLLHTGQSLNLHVGREDRWREGRYKEGQEGPISNY